jgi:L-histidine N-alpha-methyltransferase
MGQETNSHIFSRKQKDWHLVAPSIWAMNEQPAAQDPALAILKTLFDQPSWLQASHLYDEKGSHLFEQICELPEYYPTRTEESILEQQAAKIIGLAPVECIVELGAGFSKKTVHLLREQTRQRQRAIFAPLDVSITGLEVSRDAVEEQFPQLTFQGIQSLFDQGIACIDKELPTLFVFLGGTLGNLSQPEFIQFFEHLSDSMGPHDFLLLGVDRVKDTDVLSRAYDDSQGITAAFILNVFDNINRLLNSNFDRSKMKFDSRYNSDRQRIEMSSIATSTQEIHFPTRGASFKWTEGQRILVEISRKFIPSALSKQLQFFDLESVGHFTDPKEWFSLLLLKKSLTT